MKFMLYNMVLNPKKHSLQLTNNEKHEKMREKEMRIIGRKMDSYNKATATKNLICNTHIYMYEYDMY